MANVFEALAPVLYSAAQEVSAEPFGVIDAISRNFDDRGVAVGDVVSVPVASSGTPTDFVPGNVSPQGDSDQPGVVGVRITASKKRSWHLTGEQRRSLENSGTDKEWLRQKVMQEMRALRNAAEADCALAVVSGASRAVGTPGTRPFAESLDDLVLVRKVLRDNGAPMADPQFVCDTWAEANLLKLAVVQNAASAGSDEERRLGIVRPQFGFRIGSSAQIGTHEKGPGEGYVLGSAGLGVGKVSAVLEAEFGSGSILAGDVVTFEGDTAHQYVVQTGVTGPAQTLGIGRPGARVAIAGGSDVTVLDSYTPCLAFERGAVVGIMRPPAVPENPTIQQALVSDSFGMTYLLLEIAQYGQVSWELHLAWGFKVVQSEHVALLLG